MRKVLLFCLLSLSISVFAQNSDTTRSLLSDSVAANIKKMEDMRDSAFSSMQTVEVDKEAMQRNLDSFVRMQKERNDKEKRNAMIRIGIGVLFLIVLIVGWMRKGKKNKG